MNENNENRQRNGNFGTDRNKKPFEKKDFNPSFKRPQYNSDGSNDRKYNQPYNKFKKRDDSQQNSGEKRFNSYNNENRGNNNGEKRFNSYNSENRGNNNGENRGNYNRDNRDTRGNYSNNNRSSFNKDNNQNRFNNNEGNALTFRKKSFSNDENRPGNLSFRTAKEVQETKFVETRFDENGKRVNFRPRKKSSDYDANAKYSKKKQFEYQKAYVDPTKPVRLNKFLANAGICSRREADEFIQAGVITVNGEFVTELGTKILPTDKVMFHDQPVRSERKVYLLLNKPKDCVTTLEDAHARMTVLDLVKNACSERIYPVGRLDRNTTGVLLLTNDGDLASKLTHPKYEKKKIYHVMLDKDLSREDFEQILSGIQLEDFKIAADALDFVKEDSFNEIGVEIHTGQNRVVRRIFEKLGYRILRLDRVYFAGLTKKNLPRGKYRFLNEREVNMLKMGAYK